MCKPASLPFTVLAAIERVVQRYGTTYVVCMHFLSPLFMFFLCTYISSVYENFCLFLTIGSLPPVCHSLSIVRGRAAIRFFFFFSSAFSC